MRIKSEFREGMKKKNIKKFCILNYKKIKSIIVETFELEKLGNFSNLFKINDRSEILNNWQQIWNRNDLIVRFLDSSKETR